MQATHCSLCINKCSPPFSKLGNPSERDLLENQLRVIFLFQKVLEMPQDICCTFLENYGDPCSWIDCCVSCSVIVQNGKLIFDQMMLLQKQFETVQNQLKKQIIRKLALEENVFTKEKLKIKETMRSFIRQGNSNGNNIRNAGMAKHNSPSNINDKESCAMVYTLDTDNSMGPIQCVNNELGDYFKNPFTVPKDDQYYSKKEDPLYLNDNGNYFNVYSDLDIKEENIVYQLGQAQSGQELNSAVNTANFKPPSEEINECSENSKESSDLNQRANEQPNESLVLQNTKRKGKKNSKHDLTNKTINHKYGQPPTGKKTPVQKKQHKCEFCGKVFHFSSYLAQHKKRHFANKPCKCQFCGKGFNSRSELLRHERIHTGEKPFICDTCGKTFAESGNLNHHKKIHTGERPHKCSTCGKCFINTGGLRRHIKGHTGEKPHKCAACGKAFIYYSGLYHHQKVHTGEKTKKYS